MRLSNPVSVELRKLLAKEGLSVQGTPAQLLKRIDKARAKATKDGAASDIDKKKKQKKAKAKHDKAKATGAKHDNKTKATGVKKEKKKNKKLICQMSAKEYLAKCGGDVSKCRPQPRLMGDGSWKVKVVRVKPGKTPQWVNM